MRSLAKMAVDYAGLALGIVLCLALGAMWCMSEKRERRDD